MSLVDLQTGNVFYEIVPRMIKMSILDNSLHSHLDVHWTLNNTIQFTALFLYMVTLKCGYDRVISEYWS